MSMQSINLSAQDLLNALELKLPARWEQEAGELDTICVNTPEAELGFIVTLVIDNGAHRFIVHEFAFSKATGQDREEHSSLANYDEVLNHLRERVQAYEKE